MSGLPEGLSKDVTLANGPEDSISDLSWSSAGNYLAVASWDSKVRIYDVSQTASGEGKALMQFDAPVLSCCWSKDGQKVIGAGADKTARILDLAANGAAPQQVAAHDAPIRSVRFFEAPNTNAPMIATGSWDKTVRYWDLRQSTPVATLTCQERVYTMDIRDKLFVIGTAERHIHIVDLNNPTTFYKTIQSPLKQQTRVVSCVLDSSGFAVASIEGRCAFHYVDEKNSSSNFSFRCHREPPSNNQVKVYAVNAISFHPVYGTFSTAGSDGTFHFWDKDAHSRLKGYPTVGGTISATAFNRDGTIFSYAISYDWSKGYSFNNPQYPNKVMLHQSTDEECKPRTAKKK
ncbi:hypothetical protein VTN00DRAFT_414 [Thermoascus crustaceus]|uniref:uncharacterized protein n=1 Tax=Thermoascus crustaceus TaxID=5088 RepID=UPI00374380BE